MAKKDTVDPGQKKGAPKSFRFSAETIDKLEAIRNLNKRSASNMLEHLVDEAYAELKKKRPDDLKRIEKALNELKRP